MKSHEHAARIFTNEELLVALVAERLDRLADRMVYRCHDRLAIFGRLAHAAWLHQNVHGMRAFPICAYLTCAGLSEPDVPHMYRGRPVKDIEGSDVTDSVDTVLISDDLHEQALHEIAEKRFPPGTIIHRLYERLPIGTRSLERPVPVLRTARAQTGLVMA
jgi:hypothetical protein